MKIELSQFQRDFLSRKDDFLVIASCGVGSGKSKIGSYYAVMEVMEGRRILVGAQTYNALTKVMFAEIEKALNMFHIPYHYNKSDMSIKVGDGIIYGFTGENPNGILGLSEISTVILDEGSYCPKEAYDFALDRCRGSAFPTHIRLLSSPDNIHPAHSWFIDLLRNKPECVIYASSLDNPFTSEDYKKDLLERYPIGTPLHEQQVLGHIINSDLLNAILREIDYPKLSTLPKGHYYIGVDCSGEGRDATDYVVRNNSEIVEIVKEYSGNPSKEIQILKDLYYKYKPKGVAIDASGGFAKHFHMIDDVIKGMQYVNFGSSSSDKTYTNKRTQMYFNFAKRVREGFFIDKMYKEIYEELRNTTYTISEKGLTGLIPKELIKKNIGRSPDSSDALVLSFEAENSNVVDNTLNEVVGNLLNL